MSFFGIGIAFKDYDVITGFAASEWVGFANFVKIFKEPELLKAIFNTLYYNLFLIFGIFPFPVLFAIMINELKNLRFKKLVQTASYLPHFLSWITVVGMFMTLLSLNGPVNNILSTIIGETYERKNWLMDSKYFLPINFIAKLWKEIGWSSILYLAAIAGIDQTMYEAARIDGCDKFNQIRYITLPCIIPTMVIVLIMGLGTLLNTSFEMIYGFQNLYTQQDTEVISTLIYRKGLQYGDYSTATAIGLMQGLVSITIVFFANAISKKVAKISIF